MSHNVSVAILWHFHQPIYSKPDDNVLPLPWVRLHCLKDYLDMLLHVQNFPEIKVTFNFTPSLLLQIEAYKNGACTDKQFQLFKKKAEELTIENKKDILRDFFLANWERMVEPYKRYFTLLLKRGKNIVEDELESIVRTFTDQEFRDLQIWANLVWIDPVFRTDIQDLYEKGKNFSEADKERVITKQNTIIDSIIDTYKKAQEAGQIDITTSPMYHPILPLIINSELARMSNPNLAIPFEYAHPEDAEKQIIQGIDVYERLFGCKPSGVWPSEGSVCQEMLPMLRQQGIQWIATDEEIFNRSYTLTLRRDEQSVPNRPELLYKPWLCDGVNIVFRDHVLSDLIAFVYSHWDQEKAALDLIKRIQHIENNLPPFDKYMIPIILDGENAWEGFENDGTDFFKNLYEGLLKNKIPTTTISGFIKNNETTNHLPSLFAGSWIGGNFNIWIGHPEDHKAWNMLAKLRELLEKKQVQDPLIWDRLYILEGSDWYWWFGDEHYSAVAETFDELFRMNIVWIYRKLGEEPPPELFSSIKKFADALIVQPNDKMTPQLDGEITHFYEWYHAGHADVSRMGGTMHRFAGLFSEIHCGFDNENMYIRFDIANHDINAYDYTIKIYVPQEKEIPLKKDTGIQYAIKNICEIAIPFSILGGSKNVQFVEFIINACQKGIEIDRTPLLKFMIKLEDVKLLNWTI